MQLESVTCNQCGAPLEVPESANFVRCNHCQAQLAIKRTTSATFTEQLGNLERKTDEIVDHLRQIAYSNRLAEIDRAWDREREQLLTTNNDGRRSEPSMVGSILFGCFAAAIGVAVMLGGGGPFGLIVMAFGVIGAMIGAYKAKEYEAARMRYRRLRRSVTIDNVLPRESALNELQTSGATGAYLKSLEQSDTE